MKIKKLLLIGGNGFIGSHLTDVLLKKNFKVTVYDKFPERFRDPIKNVNYIFKGKNYSDQLSRELLSADCIIYLASSINPALKIKTSKGILSELVPLAEVLDVIKDQNKRFIYLSSGGAVYGQNISGDKLNESLECNPKSMYGFLKLSAEALINFELKKSNTTYLILRPSNPYGPRQDPFGAQGAIGIFIRKGITNESIQLFGDPRNIIKDYIYIKDLTEAIYKSCISDANGLILNIGSGIGTSLSSLLELISYNLNSDIKTEILESRKSDVQKFILNIDSARKILDWKPSTQMEDGINWTKVFIEELIQSKNEKNK